MNSPILTKTQQTQPLASAQQTQPLASTGNYTSRSFSLDARLMDKLMLELSGGLAHTYNRTPKGLVDHATHDITRLIHAEDGLHIMNNAGSIVIIPLGKSVTQFSDGSYGYDRGQGGIILYPHTTR